MRQFTPPTHNKSMKWIRQPVPALAYATSEPEQLTTYAGR